MMPQMACLERLEIDPAEEQEQTAERRIQPIAFEYRPMPELMNRIDHEPIHGSVGVNEQDHPAPDPTLLTKERALHP